MSYLSQSAAEFDALPKKVRDNLLKRAGEHPLGLGSILAAQRKYDGVSGLVDTSTGKCFSRTGGEFTSCEHIVDECIRVFGHGCVIFGEIWHPTAPQSTISGDARRNKPAPHLHFVIFDAVTAASFDDGESCTPYHQRYASILQDLRNSSYAAQKLMVADHFNPGTYGRPADFKATVMMAHGYDGIVLRDMDAPWIPGKDKTGYVIKDKPNVTHDLEVIGTEEGLGRNAGRVGAILLRYKNGVTVKCSGMSDEQRISWWDTPELILGKIVEVEAMGESSNGSLREPRFKGIRYDKYKPDF